jgi:ribosome biogenesis GTPase
MSLASFSIVRHHRTVATAVPQLLRRFSYLPISARQQNPKHDALSKNLLKAKHTLKNFSSLAPIFSREENPPLSESQAIGTVASSQANFMRVIVQSESSTTIHDASGGVELLCVVRALLKKIKRRVMVGDKVLVGSVDWVDRRGMIENVFQRNSEILDPPVANVDHLLVLFSLDQPKLEPFTLTRFLVEAESTRIPFTLALNKTELVDKEVCYLATMALLG